MPLLVWLHGGGWVVGSLESHDPLCRYLAAKTPCCVVSVNYRLAPEDPFPRGLDDAYAALEWARRETSRLAGDRACLAVGGDSAGGNLASVVARRARDDGVSLGLQVLAYPVTNHDFTTPSYAEYGEGLNLSQAKMQWYWRQYLAGADAGNPDASPLRASDLRGLPPALVQTAEHDPLRSEGEAYAELLAQSGVTTRLTRYPGVIHGFLGLRTLTPTALQALDQIAAALREPASLNGA
jgi:acetyl esterase